MFKCAYCKKEFLKEYDEPVLDTYKGNINKYYGLAKSNFRRHVSACVKKTIKKHLKELESENDQM